MSDDEYDYTGVDTKDEQGGYFDRFYNRYISAEEQIETMIRNAEINAEIKSWNTPQKIPNDGWSTAQYISDKINAEAARVKELKKAKEPKIVGRFVTLTNSEDNKYWTREQWVKAIEKYVQYKNIATDYWYYAIEEQISGALHGHIVFLYKDSGRHEGLDGIYRKLWKHGTQVKVVKMNFKTNPNALTDLLNYLGKEKETTYGQSVMWDSITI